MDDKDPSAQESEPDGMAGALARALALRSTVMQHSGKLMKPKRLITSDNHVTYSKDDEDDEAGGGNDETEWSD